MVDQQIRSLSAAGHEVFPVTVKTDDLAIKRGYRIHAALSAAGFGGVDPRSKLRRLKPDVIHVHNVFPNFSGRWLKEFGPRTVATLHNFRPFCAAATFQRDGKPCHKCPSDGSGSALQYKCYRSSTLATIPLSIATRGSGEHNPILKYASRLITLNDEAYDQYRQFFPADKYRVIPNFVDIETSSVIRSRQRSGWVFAGRLVAEKGLIWLLENWPDGHALTILGDGPLRARAEQLIASMSRTDITLAGPVPRAALLELLGRAEGLVLPSLWSEGLPTVVLEALSLGVPVAISSACGSAPRLIEQGGCVAFAAVDGAAGLRDAIAGISKDSLRMRSAARLNYETNYTPSAWIEAIESLYTEVSGTKMER